MRKNYIHPETLTVSVDETGILCSSNTKATMSTSKPQNDALKAVNDLYSGMTLKQKAAAMNLMMVLAGAGPNTPAYIAEINKLMSMAGSYMQITGEQYKSYTSYFGDYRGMVNELKGVNNRAIYDSLFLSFFSIISVAKSEQALNVLLSIYSEFGYTEEDCYNVIQKADALSKMMM